MRKNALLAAAIAILCLGAFGQEPVLMNRPVSEQAGSDLSFARLSFVQGEIFLQRASDLGYEEATINTPIGEGDRLGTTDGRAEIALGNFKFARLDGNTKIDIQNLPREASSLIRLRQMSGHLYLDLGTLDEEKSVELLTTQATFYFLDEGRYRVDIRENGTTEILVFSGLVEVAGAEGSILVKEGQRLSLTGGSFDGRPSAFIAVAEDDFDRWNEEQADLAGRPVSSGRLPSDIAEYESELDEYGEWIDVDPFGSVWVPGGMGMDWRPYSWGHWTWMPMAGWCWVPYEPWGWSTYHYGRWHWSAVYGWYWIPMSGWGPAWVSWWWDDFYYGWAPLSWWGYPGVLYNNVYYGYGWNGGYPADSRALTVVRKDQLQSPDVRRVALKPENIRAIGRIDLGKHAPDVRPALNRSLRIERLQDPGRVIIRKEGGELTRDEAARTTSRDLGKESPSSPRVIRPADRTVSSDAARKAGTPPDKTAAGRTVERKDEASKPPASKPPERRIRKKEDDGSTEIKSFPSSSAIGRDDSGNRVATSSTLVDKFYKYIQGDKAPGSTSGKSTAVSGRDTSSRSTSSSSGKSTGSTSVRSASPSRSSSGSASRSSGASRSGSSSRSSGGSVRKK